MSRTQTMSFLRFIGLVWHTQLWSDNNGQRKAQQLIQYMANSGEK